MTRQQMRVVLAKDVIKLVNANKLSVMSGNGYIVEKDRFDFKDLCDMEILNRAAVELLQQKCEVCAQGALLLCRIDRFNKLGPQDISLSYEYWDQRYCISCGNKDTIRGLDGIFTKKQLDLIETAFENTPSIVEEDYDEDDVIPPEVAFGANFEDDADRLVAIMQNIIDHNGTFKPQVQYEMV